MLRAILFLLLMPVISNAQNLQLENPVRFLALGDSYTIGQSVPASLGWPAQLSDSLSTRGYVTDTLTITATTGWRTDNLINAIRNKNLDNKNYNFISLLIGVNNQYQGRPFSQYITEFPALLDSAIRYAGGDKSHVYVVSIPDYAFTPFGQQTSDPEQISEEIDQYNAYSRQIAEEKQVPYFDITPISRLGLQIPSYVANDGLHPSGIQYTEWVKPILQHIDKVILGTKNIHRKYDLDVSVSPNPAVDFIYLEIQEKLVGSDLNIEIYNLTGKKVIQQETTSISTRIGLENIPDGVYILKITSGERIAVKKFLKLSG